MRGLGVPFVLIATGQHDSLLRGTPAESDLADSVSLGLPSTGNVWEWAASATVEVIAALRRLGATAVMVQGDTMSALAGARAASALQFPLYHVEAGLRSHTFTEPDPEERIRVEIATLATWHYAPTWGAYANLVSEGIPADAIEVTGNPVVSAMERYAKARPQLPTNTILVTMHRRESREVILRCMFAAFWWAVEHPEARVQWIWHPAIPRRHVATLGHPRGLKLTDPLPYRAMVEAVSTALGVITDSGGLQEECATLGVPCAVLRNVSDRAESLILGSARLFPPSPDGIVNALETIWAKTMLRTPNFCYGTPDSAQNIAVHVHSTLDTIGQTDIHDG